MYILFGWLTMQHGYFIPYRHFELIPYWNISITLIYEDRVSYSRLSDLVPIGLSLLHFSRIYEHLIKQDCAVPSFRFFESSCSAVISTTC